MSPEPRSSATPGACAVRYRRANSWSCRRGVWVCSWPPATTLDSRDESLTVFVQQSPSAAQTDAWSGQTPLQQDPHLPRRDVCCWSSSMECRCGDGDSGACRPGTASTFEKGGERNFAASRLTVRFGPNSLLRLHRSKGKDAAVCVCSGTLPENRQSGHLQKQPLPLPITFNISRGKTLGRARSSVQTVFTKMLPSWA